MTLFVASSSQLSNLFTEFGHDFIPRQNQIKKVKRLEIEIKENTNFLVLSGKNEIDIKEKIKCTAFSLELLNHYKIILESAFVIVQYPLTWVRKIELKNDLKQSLIDENNKIYMFYADEYLPIVYQKLSDKVCELQEKLEEKRERLICLSQVWKKERQEKKQMISELTAKAKELTERNYPRRMESEKRADEIRDKIKTLRKKFSGLNLL